MSMPSILKKITDARKIRLEREKAAVSLDTVKALAQKAGERPRFGEALIKEGLSIIGEIKKASPSKGLIRPDFDPAALAKEYEKSVDALSVLTEEDFFLGSPEYLRQAAKAAKLPILRKDFLTDPYQIYEAKALGASAVLLITAILDAKALKEMLETAHGIGLEALVEVHSLQEADIAAASGAKIIGINNRDLNTFDVDLDTTIKIAGALPGDIIKVSESGFHTAGDIKMVRPSGIDAVLVGESFMKSGDIPAKAREFKDAYAD